MIEINLVPDVKIEMLRAQRMRNIAISMSIIAGAAAVAVVVVMGLVIGTQAALEGVTSKNIKQEYEKLSRVEGVNDILTLQNQLSKISQIHDNKTLDSRLLDVLLAVNPPAPNDIKFSKITLDPKTSSLTIEGSATGGFSATEVFRKTILNTKVEGKYAGDDTLQTTNLTDKVTIKDTSYGTDSTGAVALRFTMTMTYLDSLFSNKLTEVRIVTPTDKIDVTDSKTRVPDSLFSQPVTTTEGDK
ncbi:MAG: hypothetical protein WBP12_00360 [Candidatus Saccharimonas sp.]